MLFVPSPRPALSVNKQVLAIYMTEGELQAHIIDAAKKLRRRWRVVHFADSRKQVKPGVFVGDELAADWPDLAFIPRVPGLRPFYRELKGYQKKGNRRVLGAVSKGQDEMLFLMRQAGDDVDVWTPEHWLAGVVEERLMVAPSW